MIRRLKKHIVFVFLAGFVSLLLSISVSAAVYTLGPSQENLLSSKSLHIFICGSGDPESGMQAVRRPSCLAVIGDGQFLLFDAGEGSVATLGELGLPFENLNNVFITHWHSDHLGGLGQVINEAWLSAHKTNVNVYGPKGVKSIVRGINTAYKPDVRYRVKNRQGVLKAKYAPAIPHLIKPTKKGVQVYNKNSLKLSAFLVDHYPVVPAFGYRIQYKGCKVVISGDTKIVNSLKENATKADVLVNEAISNNLYKLTVERLKKKPNPAAMLKFNQETYNYHSDSLELAKMATAAGVKNLFVTHLVPAVGTSKAMRDSFSKGMDKYYKGPITVVNDRDEIVVTPENGQCKVTYYPAAQPAAKFYPIGSVSTASH